MWAPLQDPGSAVRVSDGHLPLTLGEPDPSYVFTRGDGRSVHGESGARVFSLELMREEVEAQV